MNLAVFLPNWIGDVVMATPALRALRILAGSGRVVAVCRPYVTEVVAGSPWFDDVLPLDRKGSGSQRWPGVAWKLRRERIDRAVLLPNSFRSALSAWLGGCKERVGFRRYGRGFMLSTALEAKRDERGRFVPCPILDDYNRLAVAAGCADPGHRMELFTTYADEERAEQVWQKQRLKRSDEVICLNPGAAFGAAKHWPTASFARLAQALVERRGARVLVLCGPSERELARAIVSVVDRPGVGSLADEALSLGLTKAIIRRASLLVTTDSGPRHFAAAFGRPVVSLFGPTHIAWTETYYADEVHLQKPVPCGPCQQRVCPTDHACMRDLMPTEVFTAVERLLARVARRRAS